MQVELYPIYNHQNDPGWYKLVEGVNLSGRGGYCFEGPFLIMGQNELPIGAIVIGKRRPVFNGRSWVSEEWWCFRVEEDGLKTLFASTKKNQWKHFKQAVAELVPTYSQSAMNGHAGYPPANGGYGPQRPAHGHAGYPPANGGYGPQRPAHGHAGYPPANGGYGPQRPAHGHASPPLYAVPLPAEKGAQAGNTQAPPPPPGARKQKKQALATGQMSLKFAREAKETEPRSTGGTF